MKLLVITNIDRYQRSVSTPIFTKVVPSETNLTQEFLKNIYSEMLMKVYELDVEDENEEPTFMVESDNPIQIAYVWGEESDCQIMLIPMSQ